MFMFFFFQAEDGIRDIGVTGVQTCALPIFFPADPLLPVSRRAPASSSAATGACRPGPGAVSQAGSVPPAATGTDRKSVVEGKSVDLGGRRIIKKKNRRYITSY